MRLYKTFKDLTSWSSIICELNDIILHLELKGAQSVLTVGHRNRQQRLMGQFYERTLRKKFDPKPSPHQFQTFCCLSPVTTSGLAEGS